MMVLGIDPGKAGCIFGISDDEMCQCRLDETPADIWLWLQAIPRLPIHAFVEKVSSSPQMGVVSAFTFGRGVGLIEGILTAARIPYEYVTPQKWQRVMGCMTGGDKNVSKRAAQRLWPDQKWTHATSDAALIAEYGRRTLAARVK